MSCPQANDRVRYGHEDATPPLKKRPFKAESDDEDKKCAPTPVAQEKTSEALEQLRLALELIPPEHKVAYTEALERVPEIIDSESNPVWFLRCEECDCCAAARRLVAYWKERKELFGDRFIRPLKLLTGEGALNDEDMVVLRSGLKAILPKDGMGRNVLLFDLDRKPDHVLDPAASLRVYFCLVNFMAENEMTQTEGFVMVVRMRRNAGVWNDKNVTRFSELIRTALPSRIKTIHLVSCHAQFGRAGYLQKVLPAHVANRFTPYASRTVIHGGDTPNDLCRELQAHLLSPRGLPDSIGGKWKYDQYLKRVLGDSPDWAKGPPEAGVTTPQEALLGVVSTTKLESLDKNVDANSRASCEASADEFNSYFEAKATDIYYNGVDEYAAVAERGCFDLENALELLSDREKAAYTEATQRAPELIDSESDPLKFLRCAKYNAWVAAHHLARYWEKRLVVFGKRAFLPMTKTGNGTLSEEDARLLESGYLSFLPDDKEGNPVVCYDDSRLPHDLGDPEGLSRLRCLFYTLSVVSERRRSSLDGFVGIEIMNTQLLGYSESCFAELVATAMPIHLKALHLVHFPADDAGKKKLLHTIFPNTLKRLGASAFEWTHIHTGSTQEEILDKMQTLGSRATSCQCV